MNDNYELNRNLGQDLIGYSANVEIQKYESQQGDSNSRAYDFKVPQMECWNRP